MILTLLKPVLFLMLLLNTASCRSPDTLRRIAELERITGIAQSSARTDHDTLYLSHEKYDSIYLSENSTERYRPSSFHYDTLAQIYCKVDTLYKERAKTEFRYKLLHDTTYIHKVDTIPKVITITRTEKEIPKLCWIIPFMVLILLFSSCYAKLNFS